MTIASPAQSVDPAIVAYLGATMALLKLWYAESQRIATTLRDVRDVRENDDDTEQPVALPSVQYLESIRVTVTTLPVPEACHAAHQAFVQAMVQGLDAYQAMRESANQADRRVAMLSGMENFAWFDAELARLEQQFGPFEA